MILVKKALSIICKNTKKNLATENINTEKSLGRILAENIRSVVDNPPFNMSAMDGYAVHDNPSTGIYKVVDVTFAGKPTKKRLTKGVVTDGQIRRANQKNKNLQNLKVKEIMTLNPITISKDTLAAKALSLMNTKKITSLCVNSQKSKKKTIGIIHIHNILEANIQ